MLRLILGTSDAGVKIAVKSVSIHPTVSATINYQHISNTTGVTDYEFVIDGQQYGAWANDDTIIYHIICARHNLQYVPYVEPQYYNEAFIYKNAQGQFVTETIQKPNPYYVNT
jgi:hypothetical protein